MMLKISPMLHFDDPPTMDELGTTLPLLKTRKTGKTSWDDFMWWCVISYLIWWRLCEEKDKFSRIGGMLWLYLCPRRVTCNWRGISLLDVVWKVMGRVIQERLQMIAEGLLPDSPCDFRRGHGCIDMIFVARQLMEKARKHDDMIIWRKSMILYLGRLCGLFWQSVVYLLWCWVLFVLFMRVCT